MKSYQNTGFRISFFIKMKNIETRKDVKLNVIIVHTSRRPGSIMGLTLTVYITQHC